MLEALQIWKKTGRPLKLDKRSKNVNGVDIKPRINSITNEVPVTM